MTNSADPDQLASQKPTDLDLHCLQRQGICGLSRLGLTGIKAKSVSLSDGISSTVEQQPLEEDNLYISIMRNLGILKFYRD